MDTGESRSEASYPVSPRRLADAARYVVAQDETFRLEYEAGNLGSTRGKKASARSNGAIRTWEALTGLPRDEALALAREISEGVAR